MFVLCCLSKGCHSHHHCSHSHRHTLRHLYYPRFRLRSMEVFVYIIILLGLHCRLRYMWLYSYCHSVILLVMGLLLVFRNHLLLLHCNCMDMNTSVIVLVLMSYLLNCKPLLYSLSFRFHHILFVRCLRCLFGLLFQLVCFDRRMVLHMLMLIIQICHLIRFDHSQSENGHFRIHFHNYRLIDFSWFVLFALFQHIMHYCFGHSRCRLVL